LKNQQEICIPWHGIGANQINKEWIERYLNEAHSLDMLLPGHFNVMAWSDNPLELKQQRTTQVVLWH
jgi:hypothetical protein